MKNQAGCRRSFMMLARTACFTLSMPWPSITAKTSSLPLLSDSRHAHPRVAVGCPVTVNSLTSRSQRSFPLRCSSTWSVRTKAAVQWWRSRKARCSEDIPLCVSVLTHLLHDAQQVSIGPNWMTNADKQTSSWGHIRHREERTYEIPHPTPRREEVMRKL